MAVAKAVRDKLLVDAMHRCCLCPEHHDIIDAHHIVPIAEDGPDTEENLMAVCPTCHAKITRIKGQYTRDQLRMYKERWVQSCALGLTPEERPTYAYSLDNPAPAAAARMPLPPVPHWTRGYTPDKHFAGRVAEREMLTDWWLNRDEPILVLRAIGGMGKSSVAWVWARGDLAGQVVPGLGETAEAPNAVVPEGDRPQGILWWSFYEGGGTYRGFLEEAIAYCSAGEATVADYTMPGHEGAEAIDYARMQDNLLVLLQKQRLLIVWDGAERLLREYGARDAEIREERDPEELEPDACDVLEPAVGRLLRESAAMSASRLLLVTRLRPRPLDGIAGVHDWELTGLRDDDAVAFLRARGIAGTRAELEVAGQQYGCHPLSLSNLAAALIEDFEDEGDISGAPDHDPTESLRRRHHHILERAFGRRSPQAQALLSRLAAVRGSIPREVVRLLAEAVEGLDDDQRLGRELQELGRHGLLRHERPGVYGFHPIVRQYAYDRLGDREGVHGQLRDYFDAVPEPDEIETIEDLTPVIELYHHTVRAGRYDEAFALFQERLRYPLDWRLGAYETRISLLRELMAEGDAGLPKLQERWAQAVVLNHLAIDYSRTGQPRRAVSLLRLHNQMRSAQRDRDNLGRGLVNLATSEHALGQLEAAETDLREAANSWPGSSGVAFRSVMDTDVGRLMAYMGEADKASEHLASAQEAFTSSGWTQSLGILHAHRGLCALLAGEAEGAREAAEQALQAALTATNAGDPVERDFVRAEWLLGWARVALADEEKRKPDDHLREAEGHLREALTRCRRINMVDHEPDILLAWARWHRLKGNLEEALGTAREALAIADRCEYRLCQAGIHNFLARMAMDEGDRETAAEEAAIAYERAWCDGPPYCYKPALDEAEAMLKELGVEPPELPPYTGPMPEEWKPGEE